MQSLIGRSRWAADGLRDAVRRYAIDELGSDDGVLVVHCEARSWHGWHRHMSLCMAAAAFLAKLAADLRRATWSKPNKTSPAPSIAA